MKIAVAGTGYVGLSISVLLAQHNKVTAVDIIPEKVEMINNKKSPIQDDYIEKYLAEKELDLTATLDGRDAYSKAEIGAVSRLICSDEYSSTSIQQVDILKSTKFVFGKMYSLTLPGGYEILLSVPTEVISAAQRENTQKNTPDLLKVSISGRNRGMQVLEEGVTYAGNYPRGSKRYQEFLAFVKEHASFKEENGDEESTLLEDRQETVYKLEKEDVEEWGEPCNFVRFLTDKDTFVNKLTDSGYEMKLLETEENNQVEVNGYGGISTSFVHKERYQVSDGVFLTVNSDTVNHQMLGVAIYREKGSNASLKELAVCVTAFIQGAEVEESSELPEMLDEVEADIEYAKDNTFIVSDDAALMFSDSEDSDYEITIVSQNVYENNPYWP